MRKGTTHSEESREKMSKTRFGKKLSDSHKKSISRALRGKPKSPEHILAASIGRKGVITSKFSDEARRNMSLARKRDGVKPPIPFSSGIKLWKNDPKTYISIHNWVKRNFGRPTTCEDCFQEKEGHFIHWANVSGEYRKDRIDWKRLCAKCHKRADMKNITWRKV